MSSEDKEPKPTNELTPDLVREILEQSAQKVVEGTDQAMEARIATLTEIVQALSLGAVHDHGTCEDCSRLNQESYSKGENAGMAQTVKYYEAISGVTELRQEAELLKATIKLVP